jgi:hypothetical protein
MQLAPLHNGLVGLHVSDFGGGCTGSIQLTHSLTPPGDPTLEPIKRENGFKPLLSQICNFVQLHFGFRIVTTALPRRTLKSYPMATLQLWSSTKKIFKFSFTDDTSKSNAITGDMEGKVNSCQLCTTWWGAAR